MTSAALASSDVGAQEPRLRVVPAYVASAGAEAIEVAEVAGLHLDPWEKLVLTDALGETDAGRWAAYRVGVCCPRQNGKGAILEARELAGLFAFGERLIIHSAHEQATATEHFNRVLNLMEGVPEFDRRILKVTRGKGLESITLRRGYRIFFKTRTGGGGRGFTGNLVVFDEAMILAAAFMAALVPTMAAQSIEGDPQLWFAGSAVDQQKTEHGIEFARVRADALNGHGRLAYFDWSVEGDDPSNVPTETLDDPAAWAQANPGLGIRIASQYIEDERGALGDREFAVERLGIGDWPTIGDDGAVISLETWGKREDPASKPLDPVVFTLDGTPDRTFGAVAAAGRRQDGRTHVEIIRHAPGLDWMVDYVAERVQRHDSLAVLVDQAGPAGALIPKLREKGIRVNPPRRDTPAALAGALEAPISAQDLAQACGRFYDDVQGDMIRHIGQPILTSAIKGATKRPLVDAWAWSRKNSTVDISPLVAATLAVWAVATIERTDVWLGFT